MTEKEIKDRIENNICLECGKPITDDGKFFCKDCLEKSKEHFYKTEIGKSLKDSGDNGWGWLFGLMIFSGLGNDNKNEKSNNNDKN